MMFINPTSEVQFMMFCQVILQTQNWDSPGMQSIVSLIKNGLIFHKLNMILLDN